MLIALPSMSLSTSSSVMLRSTLPYIPQLPSPCLSFQFSPLAPPSSSPSPNTLVRCPVCHTYPSPYSSNVCPVCATSLSFVPPVTSNHYDHPLATSLPPTPYVLVLSPTLLTSHFSFLQQLLYALVGDATLSVHFLSNSYLYSLSIEPEAMLHRISLKHSSSTMTTNTTSTSSVSDSTFPFNCFLYPLTRHTLDRLFPILSSLSFPEETNASPLLPALNTLYKQLVPLPTARLLAILTPPIHTHPVSLPQVDGLITDIYIKGDMNGLESLQSQLVNHAGMVRVYHPNRAREMEQQIWTRITNPMVVRGLLKVRYSKSFHKPVFLEQAALRKHEQVDQVYEFKGVGEHAVVMWDMHGHDSGVVQVAFRGVYVQPGERPQVVVRIQTERYAKGAGLKGLDGEVMFKYWWEKLGDVNGVFERYVALVKEIGAMNEQTEDLGRLVFGLVKRVDAMKGTRGMGICAGMLARIAYPKVVGGQGRRLSRKWLRRGCGVDAGWQVAWWGKKSAEMEERAWGVTERAEDVLWTWMIEDTEPGWEVFVQGVVDAVKEERRREQSGQMTGRRVGSVQQ